MNERERKSGFKPESAALLGPPKFTELKPQRCIELIENATYTCLESRRGMGSKNLVAFVEQSVGLIWQKSCRVCSKLII